MQLWGKKNSSIRGLFFLKRVNFNILYIILFIWPLSSCVTGLKIEEVNQSLEEIRGAIKDVSGDFKKMSANKKIYESIYFSRKPVKNFDPLLANERLYARFSILGDRRPYSILIEVIAEEKQGNTYKVTGNQEDLAEKLGEDLKRALSKSREDRNAIDSFRAF